MAKRRASGSDSHVHMSAFGGHPIQMAMPTRAVEMAGPSTADQLAGIGVTDLEQLVAISNTPGQLERLAKTIDSTKPKIASLVKQAKEMLPPDVVATLERPLPPIYALGALEPPESVVEGDEGEYPMQAAALPPSVNLIPHMSSIRHQGARGTCVSFTLAAINEYARRLQAQPQDLSEQHLYDEIKRIDGLPGACGTWQKHGAQVLASIGQAREIIWPYNPNLPCNNNGTMPANARADAANYKITLTAISPKNVSAIKASLANRCPAGISIPVYSSWYASAETKRSGRITMPLAGEGSVGGHALCLAGYQDSPTSPGGGYFIVRNSWGTGWGYENPYGQGYGVIPYLYIATRNWECYAWTGGTLLAESTADVMQEIPAERHREVRLTVRGNVHLILE